MLNLTRYLLCQQIPAQVTRLPSTEEAALLLDACREQQPSGHLQPPQLQPSMSILHKTRTHSLFPYPTTLPPLY